MKKFIIILGIILGFLGCNNQPNANQNEIVKVVPKLDLYEFSGTWYMVGKKAKTPCELPQTTINYSINGDKISYLMRKNANGKISNEKGFIKVDENRTGALEISRFGIFYDPYYVVNLDINYESALIIGETNFFVIARKPSIPYLMQAVYENYIIEHGFNGGEICWAK